MTETSVNQLWTLLMLINIFEFCSLCGLAVSRAEVSFLFSGINRLHRPVFSLDFHFPVVVSRAHAKVAPLLPKIFAAATIPCSKVLAFSLFSQEWLLVLGLSLAADRLILLITLSLCAQGCLFAATIRTDFCFVSVRLGLVPSTEGTERVRFPSFSHLESSSALLFPCEICALSCFSSLGPGLIFSSSGDSVAPIHPPVEGVFSFSFLLALCGGRQTIAASLFCGFSCPALYLIRFHAVHLDSSVCTHKASLVLSIHTRSQCHSGSRLWRFQPALVLVKFYFFLSCSFV
jgi:hypothetical protein